jgi:uncharacterized caspase-like protein
MRSFHRLLTARTALILFVPVLLFVCLPGTCVTAQDFQTNRQLQRDADKANKLSQRRIALVIGNGAYTSAPPLKNPPNDARDMAGTLKALGFEVTSGVNVNQRDFKRLIREFGLSLKTGGSGLFYYAGHGVQSRGRNFLIPVDADIQSEAEVEDAGVDVNLVLNFMDDAQNGLNIVILDACRNNPFGRSFRSAENGLAQIDAPTGTLIAYATAPGRVAADGTGENGLYTAELLKQMRVPGLSVTEMFMHVRAEVMKQTASKQVPWEASSLVGTFYFGGPGNNKAGSQSDSTAANTAAFELSYWDSIKNSNDPEDFQAYLTKYPNGQFTALARNNLRRLAAPPNRQDNVLPKTENATSSVPNSNKTSAPDLKGLNIIIYYRNSDGVDRLADANKMADRLKARGANVYLTMGTNEDRKDLKGILIYRAQDVVIARGIMEYVSDIASLTMVAELPAQEFHIWLQ